MSVVSPPEDRLRSGDLLAEVRALASKAGPNETAWTGLTAFRLDRPHGPLWAEVPRLTLCGVVQGRKRLVVGGSEYICDPAHFLLVAPGLPVEAQILDASGEVPYLSFALQIDLGTVSSVLLEMVDREVASSSQAARQVAARAAHVAAFDQGLASVVLRFLRSVANVADRRVLAPLYLREITYRLMQDDPASLVVQHATADGARSPVPVVARYIREHMAEPITVADMAAHALMSPSALTTAFVAATGMGPYQYAKRMRLDHARALLLQGGRTVSAIAREVGYTSHSYFINEFKRQFGTTPRAYAQSLRDALAKRAHHATARQPTEPSIIHVDHA